MVSELKLFQKAEVTFTGILWCMTLLTLCGIFVLIYKSFSWGLVLDAAMWHYVAWLIMDGAVPYRDIFDVNFPGTYFIHMFVIKCIGESNIHWRIFDLACLVAINCIVLLYCRPFGRLAGWIGVVLFSVFHLYNGPLYLGQRDYVLLIFLIGSFYCLAQHCEKIKGYSYLAVAGLLLGAAACIKPYIGLLCCLLLVVIVAQAVRARTGWAKNAVVFTMFCCVVPAVMAAYLFICGGLQAFLDILFNYLLPFYSNFVFQPFIRGTLSSLTGMPFLEIPAILVIACAACLIGRQYRMRRILLAVGMIYGFFHFYFQVRNAYQLYPFVFFMFLCIASWAGFIRSRIPLIYKYIMVAIILHVSILALYRTSSNLVAPPASHIKEYLGSVNLYNDLKDNVGPEQTVQVMDIVTGGIHALYKLRIKQPTRFIYDAHFFHDINEPYIQNLRSEFIQDLRKKPPVFLALSPISWPVKGYERLEAFPELAEWLAANYQLEIERNTYRLYRRIKF